MNDGVFRVVDILNKSNFIELNLDNFVSFDLATIDVDSSNNFLNKLWENFNAKFSPKGKDYCPWAYLPKKYQFEKLTFTYFGSMRTSIGYIHAGVSYKKRGTIDKLHLFSLENNLNGVSILPMLKELVNDARKNNNTFTRYILRCNILSQQSKNEVLIENYKGTNFIIDKSNECNNLLFKIQALNPTDALNKALKKVDSILDFLSIETNALFEYGKFEFCNEGLPKQFGMELQSLFQNDYIWDNDIDNNLFIDFHPIVDNKFLLSKEAIKIIDKILLDDSLTNDPFSVFLKSCYHFRNSLLGEINIQSEMVSLSDTHVLMKTKIENNHKTIIDGTVTGYLSSVETVTSSINKTEIEKCTSCGQLMYSITHRVKSFMDRYIDVGFGDIFKRIYNLRSLYLHTGESCTSTYIPPVRPLLDVKTGTGAVDYYDISVNINGASLEFSIINIREWVSYSLRNYYRQELTSRF